MAKSGKPQKVEKTPKNRQKSRFLGGGAKVQKKRSFQQFLFRCLTFELHFGPKLGST
jgi:hypothetical protein